MKKYITVVGFAIVFILSAAGARAQEIKHHGTLVDEEGTHDGCLACHDGSMARRADVCTFNCSSSTPHSILKRYPPRGKKRFYASRQDVAAKGVRIVNGTLTCISCHNLRNPAKGHLVVDGQGRHCTICHIDKKDSMLFRRR
jgi:hypothetical protein